MLTIVSNNQFNTSDPLALRNVQQQKTTSGLSFIIIHTHGVRVTIVLPRPLVAGLLFSPIN